MLVQQRKSEQPAGPIVVLVGYCIAFVALDFLSHSYAGRPAASPWYLPAALGFYLVYTFGPRYAAAPILAELLNSLVAGPLQHQPWTTFAGFGVEMSIAYSGAAVLLRNLRVRIPFSDLRDAFLYIGIAVFVAPAAAGFLGVANFALAGLVEPGGYLHEVVTFAVGDSIGFLILVPALATFLTPWIARDQSVPPLPEERRIGRAETVSMVAVVFGVAFLGYSLLELGSGTQLYYFFFLPLVWMAARGGLRLATIGIVFADVSVVVLDYWFREPMLQSLSYQSYVASSSLAALTLGAVVNQRWRDYAADLARASVDRVTGLPNPRALDEWLRGYHFHRPLTMLLAGIDNMRWVNEGLHRQDVDLFLKCVGERLQQGALGYRFLAHTSDSEFAIVLRGDDKLVAESTAEKIRSLFQEPLALGESEIYASVSIGISTCSDRGAAHNLVPHAAQALDEATKRASESVSVYVAREAKEPLISLAAQLHRAVANDEFEVLYQPIFALPSEPRDNERLLGARICGAEALLRWNHPQRGLLTPFHFIDLLESMSLSQRVGGIVIDKATAQLAKWHVAGTHIELWINGFVRQVLDPEFPGSLRATLLAREIEPSMVIVELLEHEFARDEGVLLNAALRLRQSGVGVAIDDFGTGHSSLGRLREIPFDRLKIDRSFIAGIESDRRSEDVVTTLRSLARDFDAPALAEGVETEGQLRFIIQNQFHYVQGFYLGLPMTASEIDALLFEARVST